MIERPNREEWHTRLDLLLDNAEEMGPPGDLLLTTLDIYLGGAGLAVCRAAIAQQERDAHPPDQSRLS